MSIHLAEEEIADIVKMLKDNFLDLGNNAPLIFLIMKWLKHKGISQESFWKIIRGSMQLFGDGENKEIQQQILESVCNNDFEAETKMVEVEMIKVIKEVKGENSALRMVRALKSLLPQIQDDSVRKIPVELKNIPYGILSYEGPVIVICDHHKRQIVKCYVVTKENVKGVEYRSVKFNEIILLAVPTNTIIYDDPVTIETKYEIKLETYLGSSFIVGPLTLSEIIAFLKSKGLVLNAGLLEPALVAIIKSLVDSGKAEIKRKEKESVSKINMDITKWISFE